MTFGVLVALAFAAWLLSCGASLLGLYWSTRAGPRRWWAAFVSSFVALIIAYVGLSRIRLHASRTVNGHLQWSINSRWFFLGALVLGAASLALAVWNWRKAGGRGAAASQASRAFGGSGDEPVAAPKDGSEQPDKSSA